MITEDLAFVLALLAGVSLIAVLYLHRTILFGFTFFCFFQVASASLSAFVVGYIFDLDNAWISDERLWVFAYTSVALIAFNLGVLIAWKPLRQKISKITGGRDVIAAERLVAGRNLSWLNPNLVLVLLGLGIGAYLLAPFAYRIPTVNALWTSYLELLKLGVLVALILAKVRGDYKPFVIAMVVFWPIVVVYAILTGFIGAAGNFLFQLLLVACFWKGIKPKAVPFFAGGVVLILCLAFGWLNSRDLIRGNQLSGTTPQERALEFVGEFQFTSPLSLTPELTQEMFFTRFDMTDILGAQVAHQPDIEPYEYGKGTVLEMGSALVPRFIWSDKPTRAGGSEFVSKYSGLMWNADTSIDLPYQFHFYVNGGAIVVVVGLFFVGWLVARVELALLDERVSFPKFLCCFFLANTFGSGGYRFDVLIMTAVAGYFGYYLLGRVLIKLNSGRWQFWKNTGEPDLNQPKPKGRFDRLSYPLRPSA